MMPDLHKESLKPPPRLANLKWNPSLQSLRRINERTELMLSQQIILP